VNKRNVLQHPSGCPKELYDFIVHCWTFNAEKRPTASEVHADLLNCNPCDDGDDSDDDDDDEDDDGKQQSNYIKMRPSLSSSPREVTQLKESVM